MRTNGIQASLLINFPCERPDKNGVQYSREAIQNALEHMGKDIPITAAPNTGDPMIVGHTVCKPYAVQYDAQTNTTCFTVDCLIYYGGTSCVVNKKEDGLITDFEITGVGISI